MLHAGLIRHTVNKTTFSDQCYYTLGDIVTNTSSGESVHLIIIIINIIIMLLLLPDQLRDSDCTESTFSQ